VKSRARNILLLASSGIAVLVTTTGVLLTYVYDSWSAAAYISVLATTAALLITILTWAVDQRRSDERMERWLFEAMAETDDLLDLLRANASQYDHASGDLPPDHVQTLILALLDARSGLVEREAYERASTLDSEMRDVLARQPGWLAWKALASRRKTEHA
jgi:hypothetical protein